MEAHERIRLALASGVSKAELAKRAGVHPNTLRKAERDDWNAGLVIVKKVAAAADAIRAERCAGMACSEKVLECASNIMRAAGSNLHYYEARTKDAILAAVSNAIG